MTALRASPSGGASCSPGRFAALPRPAARSLLAALLLLIGIGLILHPTTNPGGSPVGGDAALYRQITARVANGQDYYEAVAVEHRASSYPLKPFTAVRPPTLAEITALLGPTAADLLLWLLAAGAGVATAIRLAPRLKSPLREAAILLSLTSGVVFIRAGMWVWHEAWAALLITIALAVRTERHWRWSLTLGLAAALVRELALPFLVVMAVAAWTSGARREARAWIGAIVIVLVFLGLHMTAVDRIARPADVSSSGWLVWGGWRFDLALARQSSLLIQLPAWVAAVVTPLALLGWASWPGGYGLRVAALLGVWMTSFLMLGRPDNDYWGFLLAPLLPVGLALAPAALLELFRAASGKRATT